MAALGTLSSKVEVVFDAQLIGAARFGQMPEDPYRGWLLSNRLEACGATHAILLTKRTQPTGAASPPLPHLAPLAHLIASHASATVITPYPARVPVRRGLPQSTCNLP